MSSDRKAALSAFWAGFRARAAELKAMTSADDPVYGAVLAELQKIHPGLWLEIGGSDFIVTAEGRQDLFALVEEVVAAAPSLPDWTFIALKPKLGFPERTRWEGYE